MKTLLATLGVLVGFFGIPMGLIAMADKGEDTRTPTCWYVEYLHPAEWNTEGGQIIPEVHFTPLWEVTPDAPVPDAPAYMACTVLPDSTQ